MKSMVFSIMAQKNISKKILVIDIWLMLVLLLPSSAWADGGIIRLPNPNGFSFNEPVQRAIIAFNDKTELLLLDVGFSSNDTGSVLRFIPFPSKPLITEGDPASFSILQHHLDAAADYIKRRLNENEPPTAGAEVLEKSGIEVLSKDRIKSHNLTVIKVESSVHLKQWIYSEIDSKINDVDLEKITDIVNHYISNGISYFVIDLVNLNKGETKPVPLIYKFQTGNIYYPLHTSRSLGDEFSSILLSVITDKQLNISDQQIIPPARFLISDKDVKSSMSSEMKILAGRGWPMEIRLGLVNLQLIWPDCVKMFPRGAWCRVFRIKDKGINFKNDFIISPNFVANNEKTCRDKVVTDKKGTTLHEVWSNGILLGTYGRVRHGKKVTIGDLDEHSQILVNDKMVIGLFDKRIEIFLKARDGSYNLQKTLNIPKYQMTYAELLSPFWLALSVTDGLVLYDLRNGRKYEYNNGGYFKQYGEPDEELLSFRKDYYGKASIKPGIYSGKSLSYLYSLEDAEKNNPSKPAGIYSNKEGNVFYLNPKIGHNIQLPNWGKETYKYRYSYSPDIHRLTVYNNDSVYIYDDERNKEVARLELPSWRKGSENYPFIICRGKIMITGPIKLSGYLMAQGRDSLRYKRGSFVAGKDSVYRIDLRTGKVMQRWSGFVNAFYRENIPYIRTLYNYDNVIEPRILAISTRDSTCIVDSTGDISEPAIKGQLVTTTKDKLWWLVKENKNYALYNGVTRARIFSLSKYPNININDITDFEVESSAAIIIYNNDGNMPSLKGNIIYANIFGTDGIFRKRIESNGGFKLADGKYMLNYHSSYGSNKNDKRMTYAIDLYTLMMSDSIEYGKVRSMFWNKGKDSQYYCDEDSTLIIFDPKTGKFTDCSNSGNLVKWEGYSSGYPKIFRSENVISIYNIYGSQSPSVIKMGGRGEIQPKEIWGKYYRLSNSDSTIYVTYDSYREICRVSNLSCSYIEQFDWPYLGILKKDKLLLYGLSNTKKKFILDCGNNYVIASPLMYALENNSLNIYDTSMTKLSSIQISMKCEKPTIIINDHPIIALNLGLEFIVIDQITKVVLYRYKLNNEKYLSTSWGHYMGINTVITGNSQARTLHFISPDYPVKTFKIGPIGKETIEYNSRTGVIKINYNGMSDSLVF